MKDLAKFLVEAKKNTYASQGEGGETILEDGSKELVYEENEFRYRDRYFGVSQFVGEETVWKDGKAIWGMNYYGKLIKETVPAKQVYNFLKEALKNVNQEKPFRGPIYLKKSEFEYHNKVEGDINEFKGTETILYNGEEVFILHFHGGLLNG